MCGTGDLLVDLGLELTAWQHHYLDMWDQYPTVMATRTRRPGRSHAPAAPTTLFAVDEPSPPAQVQLDDKTWHLDLASASPFGLSYHAEARASMADAVPTTSPLALR